MLFDESTYPISFSIWSFLDAISDIVQKIKKVLLDQKQRLKKQPGVWLRNVDFQKWSDLSTTKNVTHNIKGLLIDS